MNERSKLVLPVALAILAVWMAAAVFSFLTEEYTPLEVITPVMLTLTGYVCGFQIAKPNGRKNGSPPNE